MFEHFGGSSVEPTFLYFVFIYFNLQKVTYLISITWYYVLQVYVLKFAC